MSALLYIIQSEHLAQRECGEIDGISVTTNDKTIEFVYVDDTARFNYIEPCIKIIEESEVASGS